MFDRRRWNRHFLQCLRSVSIGITVISICLPSISVACAARPSPAAKERPVRPYWKPQQFYANETFTRNCSSPYDELWCFNGGTCFIRNDLFDDLINTCACKESYYGDRCQYYGLDNVVLPSIEASQIQSAAISIVVALVILASVIAVIILYRRSNRRHEKYITCISDRTAYSVDCTTMTDDKSFDAQSSPLSEQNVPTAAMPALTPSGIRPFARRAPSVPPPPAPSTDLSHPYYPQQRLPSIDRDSAQAPYEAPVQITTLGTRRVFSQPVLIESAYAEYSIDSQYDKIV